MSRYFFSLLVFMFVFCIGGIMFNGFDTKDGTATTILISLLIGFAAYFLGPVDN